MTADTNPFLSNFVRKSIDETHITVGEHGSSSFKVVVELDKRALKQAFFDHISRILGISTPCEQLMFHFLANRAERENIRDQRVFVDLRGAKKYAAALGKSLSKSSFHRAMQTLLSAGLVAPTDQRSWYWLNVDVFSSQVGFTIETTFVGKTAKKTRCDQTEDLFSCQLSPLVPKMSRRYKE